jgi:DNA excision repair protein ERCC-2
MQYDLAARTAQLSVGELADFAIGPRDGGEGPTGIWRAQLGTHWHREMQAQTRAEDPHARFEVAIAGQIVHRGWTITLSGRIDQVVFREGITELREIKTLTRAVPLPETELRADYPHYIAQLATYLSLQRITDPALKLRGELVFVETASGLSQTVVLTREDETTFDIRLERLTQFLDLNLQAQQRRRSLQFSPAFAQLRPGQQDTRQNLASAFATNRIVAFEAPTGFGKTGVMLENALDALKSGACDRVVYLTSKSTGQLQVIATLNQMTTATGASSNHNGYLDQSQLGVWHVRNKREHCVNHTFHCVRDSCQFLQDLESRWPSSGLDRFHLFTHEARDLPRLRQAGQDAYICPYEITRTALAFQDVWVGDFNYVFAPRNRTLFENQPNWNPARTMLIVDESHNLASRVADAHSAQLTDRECRAVLAELDHQRVSKPLLRRWETLTLLVAGTRAADALSLQAEEDLLDALEQVADALAETPLDYAALGPELAEVLWRPGELVMWLRDLALTRLLWAPRDGELAFTCLEAAPVIGATLRSFGRVLLASATIGPVEAAAIAAGLEPAELNRVQALTPWRQGAYDVAVDLRVDTRYQHRAQSYGTTARTVQAVSEAATQAVVVFFPSYRYAQTIADELDKLDPGIRVALQPKLPDLAAQTAWVEQSLALSDVLFLVLGSSFAEGIDLLGGQVSHAIVVGPALPEVNAPQRAWLEALERATDSRDAAFDRVYRVPGLQKVNQGLGRLVRAPGQRTRVILHCRRFIDPAYARWLAPDYQMGIHLPDDAALADWLSATPSD